MFLRASQL